MENKPTDKNFAQAVLTKQGRDALGGAQAVREQGIDPVTVRNEGVKKAVKFAKKAGAVGLATAVTAGAGVFIANKATEGQSHFNSAEAAQAAGDLEKAEKPFMDELKSQAVAPADQSAVVQSELGQQAAEANTDAAAAESNLPAEKPADPAGIPADEGLNPTPISVTPESPVVTGGSEGQSGGQPGELSQYGATPENSSK